LQCGSNPSHDKSLVTLIKTLIPDKGHPFGLVLATCIENFVCNNEPNDVPIAKLPDRYCSLIEDAIRDQQIIGWQHIMRRFLATLWTSHVSSHQTNVEKVTVKLGHICIQQSALSALHAHTRNIWLGRNEILHVDKDTKDAAIYTAESAELRHYHSSPTSPPSSDRHYCQVSLNKLLQCEPSV
jgi:hypothetical protein